MASLTNHFLLIAAVLILALAGAARGAFPQQAWKKAPEP
jgi:uncharacterized protein YjeT (DUF2065 family)